jgi:hypothetical protein
MSHSVSHLVCVIGPASKFASFSKFPIYLFPRRLNPLSVGSRRNEPQHIDANRGKHLPRTNSTVWRVFLAQQQTRLLIVSRRRDAEEEARELGGE